MEDDFVFANLGELLIGDSEEVLEIKSLYQREEEYAWILGPVETFIAVYYSDNKKLTDAKLTRYLRNVRRNLDKDLDFFGEEFEGELMNLLSAVLQEGKGISWHELGLVLGYILWCIDNRKWMGDKRAYLKWICDWIGIGDGKIGRLGDLALEGFEAGGGLDENEIEESRKEAGEFAGADGFWSEGSFMKSINPDDKDFDEKMKYFYEKGDESGDYSCVGCGKGIGKHNLHWHEGRCDDCFFDLMDGKGSI